MFFIKSKLVRFSIVGLIAAAIQLIFISGLIEIGAMPVVAVSISFIVAMGFSYIGQKKWTFINNKSHKLVLIKYFCVQFLALFLSVASASYISGFYWASSVIIAVVATLVAGSVSFILGLLWAFK